ncbi:MAG: glycerol-3-phosphate acyltransferase [Armatimonadota bacterium]|nr:glycerol-3-phosphate acyltransferase [Armatimonadota bacterium]
MASVVSALLAPAVGYLCGSVLPAHLLGRLRGVDFRALGKNPGTAETWRMFGPAPALVVYALDVAKAVIPLILARALRVPSWSLLLTGLAAVAGHNWSLFYRFWGGKGLATASGVVLFFEPAYFSAAAVPGLLAWRLTGWVPASGVVGFPVLIALAWVTQTDPALRAAALLLPAVILVRARREAAEMWARFRASRRAAR